MARHTSFDSLANALSKRADVSEKQLSAIVKDAVVAGVVTASTKTPIDTGQAKSNWYVSVKSPRNIKYRFRKGTRVDAVTATSTSKARSILQLAYWKVGSGDIFIKNSLEYIARLNDGYSNQNKSGILIFAIIRLRQRLRNTPYKIFNR